MDKTKISSEKQREYYLNFKNNNSDKLKERMICPICNGKYHYYSKSLHIKTKKHQKAQEIYNEAEKLNNNADNINCKLKDLLNLFVIKKQIQELNEQLNKLTNQ
jgi:hypothetical protein